MNSGIIQLRRGEETHDACLSVVDSSALQTIEAAPEFFLSAAELALYAQMRFAEKRNAFLLGRLAAKQSVAALIGEKSLHEIDVYAGAFGQPLVRHPRIAGIDVTVSHSADVAVALAYPAQWPLGIDLERVADSSVEVVLPSLEMSDAEQSWLTSGAVSRTTACGMLWSAREAMGKSMKIGLNCPLGILALKEIAEGEAGVWHAYYSNFPQSKCLIEVVEAWVLAIALPIDVDLQPRPLGRRLRALQRM